MLGVRLEQFDGRARQLAVGGPVHLETEERTDGFPVRGNQDAGPRVIEELTESFKGGCQPRIERPGGQRLEVAAKNLMDVHCLDLLDWNHPFIKIRPETAESTSNIDNFLPTNFPIASTNRDRSVGSAALPFHPPGCASLGTVETTSGDLGNPSVTVQSQTVGSRFLAYASVVDNLSGDAVFMPAR